MAGAGIFGALGALGDFGNQLGTADLAVAQGRAQQAKDAQAEAARQQAAKERADAVAEQLRQFNLKQQEAQQKKPIGTPYVVNGKTYQNFYDPVARQMSAEEVKGLPQEKNDTPAYLAQQIAGGTMKISDVPEALRGSVLDALATRHLTPKPEAKASPEEEKYDFLKGLFGEKDAKRIMGSGTLYARPKAGGGGGSGQLGEADQKRAEYYAQQIAGGKAKLSDVPVKFKPFVIDAMIAGNLTPKKPETTTEQNAEDSADKAMGLINKTLPLLEPHKTETGAWSALKQHVASGVYGHGISPGKDEEQILQTLSFLQNLGVQPWMQVGRGRYIYEQIKPHLPQAGDSLGLAYEKLQTLKGLLPSVMRKAQDEPGAEEASPQTIQFSTTQVSQ